MKVVNNLTLRPGTVVEFPGEVPSSITKIQVVEFDKFRVSLDERDDAIGFDVDTRGFRRTPEDLDEVTELPLTEFDLVTIGGVTRRVAYIEEIRPGRHQFRLEEKYKPSITVHTVDWSLSRS